MPCDRSHYAKVLVEWPRTRRDQTRPRSPGADQHQRRWRIPSDKQNPEDPGPCSPPQPLLAIVSAPAPAALWSGCARAPTRLEIPYQLKSQAGAGLDYYTHTAF